MPTEGSTIGRRIKNLLRTPSSRRKIRRENLSSKVTLDKVLGITATGNCGLTCDPRSGLVAYPAGCVVVLLNPKKNKQHHIINSSRKTITALSFSPDGKHLVTGESGHLPAVRLWDVAERRQVAELQKHKYGISCVAFSPNGKYIVSVGNQHDMIINVWAWKKDVVVAANKVSSKVTGVSFSEDSSYFVTVGNRHVKFWYLDHCKANKASDPVPLLGRSGLLGELRNNFFCDVACGRGSKSDSTFCITSSGLMCEFNSKRILDTWVDLRTSQGQSLSLSEDMIFCGCADGLVRAFRVDDLHFVYTLPRPHPLGTDVSAISPASHLVHTKADVRYPAVTAVTCDPINHWLSCVYNDHSVYVWDVRDIRRVGKVHSALFHAACVWDLEVFPDIPGASGLSSGTFFSCSADNTIRLWRVDGPVQPHIHFPGALSSDLLNIIYVDGSTAALLDADCLTNVATDKSGPDGQTAENRTGIRTVCVSPDGKQLASGDRSGMLRVYDLSRMEEILKVEAHDAEILCLEYSKPETGLKLLATASRDRLIHVLDAEDDYSLVQTLDEHSSSITAVRFAANEKEVMMISCGADKSIYFHTAQQTVRGTAFRRSHHMVRKTTLYDLSVDPTSRYAAVGCQDRCIRIFNISSGKQKKLYKGSLSLDGSLLRVQIDPSGQYVATSCSDKSISIFDFYTGECIATMFGHSEIVTGMKFTNDCKHLLSVSGDSCIFVWQLAPELTASMRGRLRQLRLNAHMPSNGTSSDRREMYDASSLCGLSSDSDHDLEDGAESSDLIDLDDTMTTASSHSSHGEEDSGDSDEGQDWDMTKHRVLDQSSPEPARRRRRRWSQRMGSLELMVKSMLDLRQLEPFGHKKNPQAKQRRSSISLEEPSQQMEERSRRPQPCLRADWLSSHSSEDIKGHVLYPEESEHSTSLRGSDYTVKGQRCRRQGRAMCAESQDIRSPDSGFSRGYDSRKSSLYAELDDSTDLESVTQDDSDEDAEEVKQNVEVTSMDEALRTVTDTNDYGREYFLKHDFETLPESCRTGGQSRGPGLSMSSRFLAREHSDRTSTKPPVSRVRPLREDTEDKTSVSSDTINGQRRADAVENPSPPMVRAKKITSCPHQWRMSTPLPAAHLHRATYEMKSLSAQNLASDSLRSPGMSHGHKEFLRRPHHHSLATDTSRTFFSFPTSPPGSPRSSRSPLPWESPRPRHSYMNPTASSMAKRRHSFSLGESIQMGTPPCSPVLPKSRRSSVELEVSSPLSSSSSSLFCPHPKRSPVPGPSHRAATVSLPPFTHNLPPSRIPLPKQPASPRRCFFPEAKQNLCASGDWTRAPTPTKDPESDTSVHRQVCSGHPTATLDLTLPRSPRVRRRRGSFSKSPSEQDPPGTGQVVTDGERPLASEQHHTVFSEAQPSDDSITVETCRQRVTELLSMLRETITLYTTCGHRSSGDQQQMRRILSDALSSVRTELDSLPPLASHHEMSVVDQEDKGEGDKTLALLEQYAELLLKSVEKRLDAKT